MNHRPQGYQSLLTYTNAKPSKGEALGYFKGILYLSPADESGLINTCPLASNQCRAACLKSSGRMNMPKSVASHLWKTRLLVENRQLFLHSLRWDIGIVIRRPQ